MHSIRSTFAWHTLGFGLPALFAHPLGAQDILRVRAGANGGATALGAPRRTLALGTTPATYERVFPSRLAPVLRGTLALQALALGA